VILTLTRDPQPTAAYCTFGTLSVNGRGKFHTIERPWKEAPEGLCGDPNASCIAYGTYRCEPRETEARGKHWIVSNPKLGLYCYPQDIPNGCYGRALVLIHAANWAHELQGCIAPGKARGMLNNEWAVLNSRAAMNEIRTLIGNTFDLQLVIQ
jgi:hypothetical protein